MEQYNADYFDTILIIDDDSVNRKILAKIFSDTYAIKEVSNGSAGLSEILTNRHHFCAILLDVVMPGMSGLEVLRHLEKMRIQEKIPVFLITAEHESELEREAYQLGVMDVILKPVIPYMVRRRVQSVIELFATRERLHNVIETQKFDIVSAGTGEMKKRYGFIYVERYDDGTGDFSRRKKRSFDWYRKVIASNGEDLSDCN